MERNEVKDRPLEMLIGEAREHLVRLGYNPDTQRLYDSAWRGLATFAAKNWGRADVRGARRDRSARIRRAAR